MSLSVTLVLAIIIILLGVFAFGTCYGWFRAPSHGKDEPDRTRRSPMPRAAASGMVTARSAGSVVTTPMPTPRPADLDAKLSARGFGAATPTPRVLAGASPGQWQQLPRTLLQQGGHRFLLPSLRFPPQQPGTASAFEVSSGSGHKLLGISVSRPAAAASPGGGAAPGPVEYVSITSPEDPGEEVLRLAVVPPTPGQGHRWACQVIEEGQTKGQLSQAPSGAFELTGEECVKVWGDLVERNLQVEGEGGVILAATDSESAWTPSQQRYQVVCRPDADVGRVVLAFLGVDRLLVHSQDSPGPLSARQRAGTC
jgi:hypothetical protein